MQGSWTVYIIETDDNLLYTGISTDPQRRLEQHRQGTKSKGARFFSGRNPRSIVYTEPGLSHGDALRREYQIKSMTRQNKLLLISGASGELSASKESR